MELWIYSTNISPALFLIKLFNSLKKKKEFSCHLFMYISVYMLLINNNLLWKFNFAFVANFLWSSMALHIFVIVQTYIRTLIIFYQFIFLFYLKLWLKNLIISIIEELIKILFIFHLCVWVCTKWYKFNLIFFFPVWIVLLLFM